jgi:flagellar protein FliO/FliZ
MFASPDAAASLPANAASSLGQVTLALMLVLAAVFVVAVLVKRMRNLAGAGTHGIEVLAQTALGSKERAVVIRVGEQRLLLGVAPGQVTLLQTLPPEAQVPAQAPHADPSARPTFASLIKRSLGK